MEIRIQKNIIFDLDITPNIKYTELPKKDNSQPNNSKLKSELNLKQNLESLINYKLDQALAELNINSSLIKASSPIEYTSQLPSPYDNVLLNMTIG